LRSRTAVASAPHDRDRRALACRPHDRPARGRDDSALRAAVLSLARAGGGRRGFQPACDRPGDGGSGSAARGRRASFHARLHRGLCARRRLPSLGSGVPDLLRGRRHRLPAGWRDRLDLRPTRACVARLRRALGSGRAARAPRLAGGLTAKQPSRGRRLRARARRAGNARHPLLHQSQRAAAPSPRAGGHDAADGSLSRGPRALAAPLPRLGASVFRPESPVRVGFPTTKEARCPSTSC
jgi:hypothetical protein